ncbi:MAG: S1 RNA-binding domain-containing protein, partial [Anaerolineae bacterium]|nr:S1 RNA-binding domain-containing protein [Anaerolineae bacterium]
NLSPGDRLEGTVRKVTLSGAIVDVGAPVDGLLHISDLGQRGVTRTSDVLKEGEPITAWVKRVDPGQNRLSLTMTEPPQFNWNDLKAGMQVEGKVVRLEKFGAFVDIGAPTDGLVHVSEMAAGRVNKPSDVVSEGAVVGLWIKEVDRRQGRISLTMVEPPDVDIRQLRPDMVLTGKVVRLETFGAFVDIGAERDGMVHVTEMSTGYVTSPSDVVSVGDEVQVRVLEVDSRRGRISLSMKDLPGDDHGWQEDEIEDMPTAMEIALREAMEEQGIDLPTGKEDRRRRKPKSKRRRYEQDDIIERTLRDHRA